MNLRKKKKGFTLIELVIVIAIIAILVAVAIPRYQKSKNKAKEVAIKSNVSMLTSAAVLRQSEMGENAEPITWEEGEEDHKEYVEQWPKAEGDDEYTVTINSENIIIHLGKKKIYDSQNGGLQEEKTETKNE